MLKVPIVGGRKAAGWVFLTLALAIGCDKSGEKAEPEEVDTSGVCIPGGMPLGQPETAREYVEMCEPELGVPPAFDCSEGVTVPITVDGVEVSDPLPNFACDAQSLQDGECFPGSTINRVAGATRGGDERPEVVWVQFCRNEGVVDDAGSVQWAFTGAQMIGYNTQSGATCFFELNWMEIERWVGRDENFRAIGVLPGHDDPEFDEAFIPPGDVQCVQCHQNEPFVHNPWIDGARLPSNPEEAVLPTLTDPNAPYYVVGGSSWDMRTIRIEGNGCLGCHRVGMETDMLFRYNGYHASEDMPPNNPGSMAADYQELLDCWEDGPENTEGCVWWYPPGGGCEGREAGDDFPFAADNFNFPRESFYGFK
jgi:hypothetical protein